MARKWRKQDLAQAGWLQCPCDLQQSAGTLVTNADSQPTPGILGQGWGPGTCVSNKCPGDSDVHNSLGAQVQCLAWNR